MEENEVKKEKTFYKKWWFWVIILATVVIIAFTILMIKAFDLVNGETGDLFTEIRNISENATVYSSSGRGVLYIELRNWSNDENANELKQIIETVKRKVNNQELHGYEKFVTLTYLENNEKDEALIMRTSYNLPDFTKDEEDSKSYIIFEEYEALFNTLSETMDGYTGLYNSIY